MEFLRLSPQFAADEAPALRGLPCEIDGYNYLRSPTERSDDLFVFDPATVNTTAVHWAPEFCGGWVSKRTVDVAGLDTVVVLYCWQLMNHFVECYRDHAQSSQMGASMGVDTPRLYEKGTCPKASKALGIP